MRSYRFYATGAATANAIAQIQVLERGVVRSIRWEVSFDSTTDGAILYLEASTQASAQPATNNSAGVLSTLRAINNFVTSGMTVGHVDKQEMMNFPVDVGQLLYLNVYVPAGVLTYYVDLYIDVG